MVYQVGRPAMFEGKRFLPETGMPIWKMDRRSTRLAVWLPDPLTVATWMLKSLTTAPARWRAGWPASARASCGAMDEWSSVRASGSTAPVVLAPACGPPIPSMLRQDHISSKARGRGRQLTRHPPFDGFTHVGGALHDADPGGLERRHLLG